MKSKSPFEEYSIYDTYKPSPPKPKKIILAALILVVTYHLALGFLIGVFSLMPMEFHQ
jgi:hypothetical protein